MKTITIRCPVDFTQFCSFTSSTWSGRLRYSYSGRVIFSGYGSSSRQVSTTQPSSQRSTGSSFYVVVVDGIASQQAGIGAQ